ncbi:MAG: hypothetical protein ACQETG_04620 [Thermodesulfobacteriota bacterium]
MNQAEKIKQMIREAELYRSQGLINEALETYRSLEDLIRNNSRIKNRDSMLSKITSRINLLSKSSETLNSPGDPPELSERAQSLIKEMFSFDDPGVMGSAAMGGAISLAEFGQYKKAKQEFEALFDYDDLRLEAAGKILEYGLRHVPHEELRGIYGQWLSDSRFSENEIEKLGEMLRELLGPAGVEESPAVYTDDQPQEHATEIDDDDILDISAVSFQLPSGPRQGEKVELEVNFQSGRRLNLIVPKQGRDTFNSLETGAKIHGVVFYSSVAIFSGMVSVSSKKEITAGPKQGDFSMDLEILRIESQ